MAKPDGGPAFPAHDYIVGDLQRDGFQKLGETRGMSLRDYFAAKALPVVMQTLDIQNVLSWPEWTQRVSETAYGIADAMLAERTK